jgi:hypothetical protein
MFVLTEIPDQAVQERWGMIFQLEVTDANQSAAADFAHASLNHEVSVARWRQAKLVHWKTGWPTRIRVDPQVTEGMLAGPGSEANRDPAGTAAAHHVASALALQIFGPSPSFISFAPQLKIHKSTVLKAA